MWATEGALKMASEAQKVRLLVGIWSTETWAT